MSYVYTPASITLDDGPAMPTVHDYHTAVGLTAQLRAWFSDPTPLRHPRDLPRGTWKPMMVAQLQDAFKLDNVRDVVAFINFCLGRGVHDPQRVRFVLNYHKGRRHRTMFTLVVPIADVDRVSSGFHRTFVPVLGEMKVWAATPSVAGPLRAIPMGAPLPWRPDPGYGKTLPSHPVTVQYFQHDKSVTQYCNIQNSHEPYVCDAQPVPVSPGSFSNTSSTMLPLTPSPLSQSTMEEPADASEMEGLALPPHYASAYCYDPCLPNPNVCGYVPQHRLMASIKARTVAAPTPPVSNMPVTKQLPSGRWRYDVHAGMHC